MSHTQIGIMVRESGDEAPMANHSVEDWLRKAQELVPLALDKAKEVHGFNGRWKLIVLKLQKIPSVLSDLSTHPLFSKNALCKEQLQAVTKTLVEAIELAERCFSERYGGKLRMQSDLDSLSGKLELNLRDCSLLIKTGVLSEAAPAESKSSDDITDLLARLQIGNLESKHEALNRLVRAMREEEKKVFAVLGRSSIAALVQLLTATSPIIRENTVSVICSFVESETCRNWLISEGALPPLVRLVDAGTAIGKEQASISLQRLSMSLETARAIVGHGGIRPLTEICKTGDSVSQAASAGALKNISRVAEVRQVMADEGVVKLMVNLLDCGILLASKEYAAECLQNLSSGNQTLRKMVISEGGVRSLLVYLDGPLPQEPAVAALRNLVNLVSIADLVSSGVLPRLVHVLTSGSEGAKQAAASAICQFCHSQDAKRRVGEAGCLPLLISMLDSKSTSGREVAAQAISILITVTQNRREVKKHEKVIANMVQLLDPNPQNSAKKYAVASLGHLSSSNKCKKVMISYGAIGYLKKLTEIEVAGSKKLVERLERGKLKRLLSRK